MSNNQESKNEIKRLIDGLRNDIKSLKRTNKVLITKADENMHLAIISRRSLAQLHTEVVSEEPEIRKIERIINDGMDDAGLKLNSCGQWEWRPRPTAKIIILTNESED